MQKHRRELLAHFPSLDNKITTSHMNKYMFSNRMVILWPMINKMCTSSSVIIIYWWQNFHLKNLWNSMRETPLQKIKSKMYGRIVMKKHNLLTCFDFVYSVITFIARLRLVPWCHSDWWVIFVLCVWTCTSDIVGTNLSFRPCEDILAGTHNVKGLFVG